MAIPIEQPFDQTIMYAPGVYVVPQIMRAMPVRILPGMEYCGRWREIEPR